MPIRVQRQFADAIPSIMAFESLAHIEAAQVASGTLEQDKSRNVISRLKALSMEPFVQEMEKPKPVKNRSELQSRLAQVNVPVIVQEVADGD